MSPEDGARASLVAHYERLATEAAARAERLGRQLTDTLDAGEARHIRERVAQLSSSIQELRRKAERIRAAEREPG